MLLCIECLLSADKAPDWIQAIASILSVIALGVTFFFTMKSIELSKNAIAESVKMNNHVYNFNVFQSYDKELHSYFEGIKDIKPIEIKPENYNLFPEDFLNALKEFNPLELSKFLTSCRKSMGNIKTEYYDYLDGVIEKNHHRPLDVLNYIRFTLEDVTKKLNKINELLISDNFNKLEKWQKQSLVSKITDHYLQNYFEFCNTSAFYQKSIDDNVLFNKIQNNLLPLNNEIETFIYDFYTLTINVKESSKGELIKQEVGYTSTLQFVGFFDLYVTLIRLKSTWEKIDLSDFRITPFQRRFIDN